MNYINFQWKTSTYHLSVLYLMTLRKKQKLLQNKERNQLTATASIILWGRGKKKTKETFLILKSELMLKSPKCRPVQSWRQSPQVTAPPLHPETYQIRMQTYFDQRTCQQLFNTQKNHRETEKGAAPRRQRQPTEGIKLPSWSSDQTNCILSWLTQKRLQMDQHLLISTSFLKGSSQPLKNNKHILFI